MRLLNKRTKEKAKKSDNFRTNYFTDMVYKYCVELGIEIKNDNSKLYINDREEWKKKKSDIVNEKGVNNNMYIEYLDKRYINPLLSTKKVIKLILVKRRIKRRKEKFETYNKNIQLHECLTINKKNHNQSIKFKYHHNQINNKWNNCIIRFIAKSLNNTLPTGNNKKRWFETKEDEDRIILDKCCGVTNNYIHMFHICNKYDKNRDNLNKKIKDILVEQKVITIPNDWINIYKGNYKLYDLEKKKSKVDIRGKIWIEIYNYWLEINEISKKEEERILKKKEIERKKNITTMELNIPIRENEVHSLLKKNLK